MQRLYSSVLNRAPSEIYPLSLHDALPISGAETRLETVASRRARREGSGKRIRPFQTSSNEPSHSTREQERRTMKYILLGSIDRKSTRLNSSHMSISYVVFCLKKLIFSHLL